MTFDNLLGYILSISMCMQSFITIVHSVRPFSLFQNLELGTASTDVKCHFAISWARFWQFLCLDLVNSNGYAKFLPFSLFQNLELGTASTDVKCHFAISWARFWQFLCLDHVSSNGYAKFYQNIPNGSRDRASFTFFRI